MVTIDRYQQNPDAFTQNQNEMDEIVVRREGPIPEDPRSSDNRLKYMQLVQPRSAVRERGEAPEGTFYCKDIGSIESVELEPTGYYLDQRYEEYHPGTKSFTQYCRATGNDIRLMVGKGEPGGNCLDCRMRFWQDRTVEGTSRTKRVPPFCRGYVCYEVFVREWGTKVFWTTDKEQIKYSLNNLVGHYGWGNFVINLSAYKVMRDDGSHIYEVNYSALRGVMPVNNARLVEGRQADPARSLNPAAEPAPAPAAPAPARPPVDPMSLPPHQRPEAAAAAPPAQAAPARPPVDPMSLPPHQRHQEPNGVPQHQTVAAAAAGALHEQPPLPGQELPGHLAGSHLQTDDDYYNPYVDSDESDNLPF